ncbi:MAG: hypothetical protein RH948_08470 [Cyclobacteriaceae bacterium]
MKDPEDYFNYRKEGEHHVYEWVASGRSFVSGFITISFVAIFFVKAFIDKTADVHSYLIVSAVAIAITLFFWIYDRFKITINKEEIFVARGSTVFFGNGRGTRYLKKDIGTFYSRSPWDYSDLNFVSGGKIIYIFLNDRQRIKITDELTDEYANYLIDDIKKFMPFGDRPERLPLASSLKHLFMMAVIVFTGAVTPRLNEVGEYASEKQSNPMRFVEGLLGMGFMFFILTMASDKFLGNNQLTTSRKILLFICSTVLTSAILYYLYFM